MKREADHCAETSYLQHWPGALERTAVMNPDPIRPPETDEEPWLPETAGPEPRRSLLARIRALLRRKP